MRRLLFLAPLLLFLLSTGCNDEHQPLSHDIYVWQRAWTPAVVSSIDKISPYIGRLDVLAAEIEFPAGVPKIILFQPDYAALRKTGKSVVLCVRIGSWGGPFDLQHKTTAAVMEAIDTVLMQARDAGIEPVELQIDFDCADAQLSGYKNWLKQIRKRSGDLRLGFTALPSWLRQADFADLLKEVDCFVLQVHSLQQKKEKASGYTLCDPDAAIGWVKEANRFKKDFSVALPTYGYDIVTDFSGQLVDVVAEEPDKKYPEGFNYGFVRSDPKDMALLVNYWQQKRPRYLKDIIWFRLPVAGDQLNWPMPAFLAVIAGKTPLTSSQTSQQSSEPGLIEIMLENTGETMVYKARIEVAGAMDKLLAAETIPGFSLQQIDSGLAIETISKRETALYPGEKITVGWLRFKPNQKISLTLRHEL